MGDGAGDCSSPRLRRVRSISRDVAVLGTSPIIPFSSLGNLVAAHETLSAESHAPDPSLEPAPVAPRSPALGAAGASQAVRMSFLDLSARDVSSPEASPPKTSPPKFAGTGGGATPKGQRRRPPGITIFKENDRHTRRAIRKEYSLYCDGHPSNAGAAGLEAVLDLAADALDDAEDECRTSVCGLSLHVAKVSTLQTARVLHDAQAHDDGASSASRPRLFADLSGSVSLYHLTHSEESIAHAATVHKVSPPIRHEAHRRGLWSALRNGTVAVVTSGHHPGDPDAKLRDSGDFLRAALGTLAGANELLLPVLWSVARERGYGLAALAFWLSFGPAKLLNLNGRKGLIDTGMDADFVVFDPDAPWTVDAAELHGAPAKMLEGLPTEKARHKRAAAACFYHGFECTGAVVATVLRGRLTFFRGAHRASPVGAVITRHGDYAPPAARSGD